MAVTTDRTVTLGVTGGIAAYKAAEVVRELGRRGCRVRVIMTPGAREFLQPLTLQTLSGYPVATDPFDLTQESEIGHIQLADAAEVFVVAPATANVIAKLAQGIADDLLTTVALATQAPWVIAPAMNIHMWEASVVQENLARLAARGARIVSPGVGALACGYEGQGRLAPTEEIVATVEQALSPQDLAGKGVLITAGPTREGIDPVRFVSNRSSGRMGFAIAAAARRRGATVTLVTGPVALSTPPGVERVDVMDAAAMHDSVSKLAGEMDLVVMAAAVADYRPIVTASEKIKKKGDRMQIDLERTTDILADLGSRPNRRFVLVGFAAETQRVLEHARQKLLAKRVDWIVANDVARADAGFDVETNAVTLLGADGSEDGWPLLEKEEVADRLLTRIMNGAGSPALSPRVG